MAIEKIAIKDLVMAGSSAPYSAKMEVKVGTTLIIRTATTAMAMISTKIG